MVLAFYAVTWAGTGLRYGSGIRWARQGQGLGHPAFQLVVSRLQYIVLKLRLIVLKVENAVLKLQDTSLKLQNTLLKLQDTLLSFETPY